MFSHPRESSSTRRLVSILLALALSGAGPITSVSQQESRQDQTRLLFNSIGQALKGPGFMTPDQTARLIKTVNDQLAAMALDPALSMGAEVSGGYQPPGWWATPGVQAGIEGGNKTVGASVKPPGRFSNLAGFQVKFKPEDEKPSLSATFSFGGEVRDGGLYQRQISVEYKFRNHYDYFTALGYDTKNVPGVRTTLGMMDAIIGDRLSGPGRNPGVSGPAATPVSATRAVLDQIRDLFPPMFEAATRFESVSIAKGVSVSIDVRELEKQGIKAAGSLRFSRMEVERINAGQKQGEGVKFTETSVGFGLGLKLDKSPTTPLETRAEGEISATFAYSDDPDKKLEKVGPDRAAFANMLRDGRFPEASAAAMAKMFPVLKADLIHELMEKLKASFERDNPNGVKIRIDDGMLASVMGSASVDENARMLDELAKRLSAAPGAADQQRILSAFAGQLKGRFKATKPLESVNNLTAVSLKSLVGRAERYASDWGQLPAELRAPGNMTRIVGFIVDQQNDDVLLIGSSRPGSPAIELDDLVVAARSVWREGNTPLVSLDPDPENPGGPQRVRVQGIPKDSRFALTLLDADYAMKKILFGVEGVNSTSFVSFKEIFASERPGESRNRFWLYPVQPQAGDIQVSGDGTAALFLSGIQVLSEELLRTREGIVGTGHTMAVAEKAAVSFTRSYKEIEKQKAIFERLHGLFDAVLLARVWQHLKIKSPVIERLAALPYAHVDVPDSYEGITVTAYQTDREVFTLSGGVQAKLGAGPRTWLVLDDPEMDTLKERARQFGASGALASPLRNVTLHVPRPDATRRDESSLAVTTAFGRLASGDAGGALGEINRLVRSDPYSAEPLAIRALINFHRNELKAARVDAERAREMAPDDPEVSALCSMVLFRCNALEGKGAEALAEIDAALKHDPTSANSHILRGDALTQLGRKGEARAEYKRAMEADPTSALAYARLGLLEISEGWVVKGKSLVKKAQTLLRLDRDSPQLNTALAFAELASAGLGNAQEQLDVASGHAQQALSHPACDPASAVGSLVVLAGVSMIREDWVAADNYIQRARKLAPYTPELLLYAADFAHDAKRDDLAEKYLAEAERLAPNSPAVKALREKVRR